MKEEEADLLFHPPCLSLPFFQVSLKLHQLALLPERTS